MSRIFPITMRLKASIYALVLVAVAAFSVTDRKSDYPSIWFALAVGGAAIAWLLVEYPLHLKIPNTIINVLLLFAAGNLCHEIVEELANDSIIISLGHFIIALMVCKLFEPKMQRDLVQIIILSLLVVVAATMFSSTNLAFPLLLMGYVLLLTYVVQVLHLRQQSDAAEALPLLAVLPAGGGRGLGALKRDLLRVTWRSLVLVAPLALAIFLVIPRARSAGFMSSWGAGMYQTGFTETVQFHDYGQLVQSDNVVMQVKLLKNDENVGSEFYEPYFRGQVMDTYRMPSPSRWLSGWVRGDRPLPQAGVSNDPFSNKPLNEPSVVSVVNGVAALSGEAPRSARDKLVQDYTILAPVNRAIFVIAPPASFWNEKVPEVLYFPADMLVRNDGPTPQHYVVYSSLSTSQTTSPPPPMEPGLLAPANGGLPAVYVSQQIRDLAHQITGLPPDKTAAPEQIRTVAADIESYLEANYPYSLTFNRKDATLDPTTDFLLNRKDTGGHCEYFASAMVMLCRAVGINARMVGGYHGGEYNSIGGYYVVRQKDAHTWTEIYVPDAGWVLYDPSPIHVAGAGTPQFLIRWARELGQITQNLWFSTVVSFDNDSRRMLFSWAASQVAVLWDFRPENLGIQMTVASMAVTACLGMTWLIRRRRRTAQPIMDSAREHGTVRRALRPGRDIRFLDDLMRLLSRQAQRRPDLTPREFVDAALCGPAVPRQDSRLLQEARWLVDTAYGLRFGSMTPSSELRTRIAEAMQNIRSGLRQPAR